ncbi:sulfotransferase [Sphaerisporangium sp. TRM90804]|uniref:sulfotransferase n=1 Tax=Sphaerisporangium sp. TRM90804 TaxID=3031113 RepID=UPI00244D1C40|nr:sulfotransferase [Sphaerisporangium sp. TRM90804]MDH2428747.1 sulfotransferase [Sphaerisporangium sp. TRM90804]
MIFVGGLGRSGTTLLERMLGEVPGIAPLGEVVHLWERGVNHDEPCGCGQRFAVCPFWRRVGLRAFGGWSPGLADRILTLRNRVDRTRHIPALAVRRCGVGLSGYTRAYSRVYEAAAQVAARPVVVDSSKHASLAFCLRTSPVVDLSVVHMVRDPRAVAHSWLRQVRRPEDGTPMARWRPWRTATHWFVQNLAFELLAHRGGRVLRVRYEDLLDDPRTVLSALLAALGLPSGRPPAPYGGTGNGFLAAPTCLDTGPAPAPSALGDRHGDWPQGGTGAAPGGQGYGAGRDGAPGAGSGVSASGRGAVPGGHGYGAGRGGAPWAGSGATGSGTGAVPGGRGYGVGRGVVPGAGNGVSGTGPGAGAKSGGSGDGLGFLRPGVVRLSVAHTCAGNPMRFRSGPLELTRDDSWREHLPRRHRWLVTALAWPLMLRYGYRVRDQRAREGAAASWLTAGMPASGCR